MKNKVSLIGTLGADPELKKLDGDKQVCNFSIATSEKYKKENGEKVEKTQWHNIVVWGKAATYASQYLKKGHKVAVDGKIDYREYINKEGAKVRVTDIVCDDFYLITPNDKKATEN